MEANTTAVPSAATEHHETRARRLHLELAETLNEAWDGRFGCETFPSNIVDERWGGFFFDIRSRSRASRQARRALHFVEQFSKMPAADRVRYHRTRLRRAMAEMVAAPDPVLQALSRYQAIAADFEARPPRCSEETLLAASDEINACEAVPTSREGAMAALRFVCREVMEGSPSDAGHWFIQAALEWFEAEEGGAA